MKTIYTAIVGDLFHYGHINFLRHARSMGDVLVVGVCGDEHCMSYKRKPIMGMRERAEVIGACRYVDRLILDPPAVISSEFLERHGIDLVVHGDDLDEERTRTLYGIAMDSKRYQSLPYTAGISTSEIIQRIKER